MNKVLHIAQNCNIIPVMKFRTKVLLYILIPLFLWSKM